jgi:hypothetical protein
MTNHMTTYLSSDSVASCREELGDAGRLETSLRETERGTKPGAASAAVARVSGLANITQAHNSHHDRVVLVLNQRVLSRRPVLRNDHVNIWFEHLSTAIRTLTSCALMGFVPTMRRAGADELKARRPPIVASCLRSIASSGDGECCVWKKESELTV